MSSNPMSSNDCAMDNSSSSSAPAAAAAATTANDATIAQCFHAMQQLTEIFQFTPQQAQAAINDVGPDVTLAYNHILDSGGDDKGGTIVPIDDCPHLCDCLKVVGIDADGGGLIYENVCRHYKDDQEQNDKEGSNRELKKGGMKGEIEEDGVCPSGENWLCVTCSCVRCSRYVNGHCKDHWQNTKTEQGTGGGNIGHCVAVSLEDFSVWCYECNAYLNHSSLKPLLKQLEDKKFGK